MKILLINNQNSIKGGAHRVFLETGSMLKENGNKVVYFYAKDSLSLEDDIDNKYPRIRNYRNLTFIEKVKYSRDFFYNKDANIKLVTLIEEAKPDIAHIHLFLGGLSLSILNALKTKNIPIVHTVHDYRLICPAYTFLDKNNNICEKCIDRFYLRCFINKCSLENKYSHSLILSADAYFRRYFINPINIIDKFIFVSNFSKQLHIKHDKTFARKSEIIYNFKPDVRKFANNNKGNYFVYFGRLSREKGLMLLVKAAKRLNINLKIIGDGPLKSTLQMDSNKNIEVLGFKNQDELWNIISMCSFVIIPSEWYENNPLAIIESFALGKPVIGSNIGGIPELIENERGLLFEPKSLLSLKIAIKKALEMPVSRYYQMVKNVINYSDSTLSRNNHYNKLLDTYYSIIKNNV